MEPRVAPESEVFVGAGSLDDLTAEPGPPSAPAPGEPLEHSGLEDLRARIEQTKAAVREALERPFAGEEPAEAVSAAGETPPPISEVPVDVNEIGVAADQAFADEPFTAAPLAAAPPVEEPLAEAPLAAGQPAAVAPWVIVEPAPAAVEPPLAEPVAVVEPLREASVGAEERGAEDPKLAETPLTAPSPEAVPVEQSDEVLAPPAADVAPPAPPPSPAQGAGVWVVPEPAPPSAASEPAAPEPAVAAPAEDETADLGPALRAVVTEEPAQAAYEAAPEAAAPAVPSAGLDAAVAEAFTFDEDAEEPLERPVVDQAEMRRRIEETRARLKAKAFDAMTSGESALLAREPGEAKAPAGEPADVQLDEEVREVIDRSLTQEDF
jgi:hypothetical protein